MAKPILVIRVNHSNDRLDDISAFLGQKLPDYHVLCVYNENLKDAIFEVYNVDKEPEIDYEELKRLINANS